MDSFETKFASQEDEDNFSLNFEKLCEEKKQILIFELKQSGRYIDVAAKKLDDLDALTVRALIKYCFRLHSTFMIVVPKLRSSILVLIISQIEG